MHLVFSPVNFSSSSKSHLKTNLLFCLKPLSRVRYTLTPVPWLLQHFLPVSAFVIYSLVSFSCLTFLCGKELCLSSFCISSAERLTHTLRFGRMALKHVKYHV